jgi:hypothetical protein
MKLTNFQLKQLIKEESRKVLREQEKVPSMLARINRYRAARKETPWTAVQYQKGAKQAEKDSNFKIKFDAYVKKALAWKPSTQSAAPVKATKAPVPAGSALMRISMQLVGLMRAYARKSKKRIPIQHYKIKINLILAAAQKKGWKPETGLKGLKATVPAEVSRIEKYTGPLPI